MAELGSVQKRSAEVKVEIAGVSTGADDAFRHRAPRTPSTHHGGRGSAVPAGPALPGWTPWHQQGGRPSLADRERRRLERGVLKRSSSPERATTATRSSSGLGAGDKKRTVVTTERDADFVPSAGISAQTACSPKRRRTPIMTPAVAAALERTRISDRTAVHLFTAVHGADATPARSTVRRHRRSARENMAKRSRRR
ncbi:hypothetical protein GWK47_027294 [Chionoecetes opilio]|uniref:Uncharacterized protein n=1 Tax=Chionoecetes opilio TaxID=41210 RepID=A0A8J8W9I8_CHIOP|nr:hypothetical protein GWK47_027294 [Chionoecetes opilio]